MISFFSKYSTNRNIIIGFFLILFINLIAFPIFPKVFFNEIFSTNNLLDLQFGFDKEFVINLFDRLQENGRNSYKFSTIFIDFPYPIAYSITFSLLFLKLFESNNISRFKSLALMPLGILFFDVLENLGIINLINSYPDIHNKSVYFTSFFNQCKWLVVLSCVVIFITMIIIKLKKKLNQR